MHVHNLLPLRVLLISPALLSERNDVASFFGVAKSCSTPSIKASELNDMMHAFGKDSIEGERLFRVSP